jgi:heat shock protein HspQ
MPTPSRIEIVRRAYQLWQEAGEPQGKDEEFYYLAEQELRNEDKSSPLRTPDNL